MKKLLSACLLFMLCLSFGCEKDIVVPDSPVDQKENAGFVIIDNLDG